MSEFMRGPIEGGIDRETNTTEYSRSLIAFGNLLMSATRTPPISSRKEPRQARSSGLVAAVLDAAVQVLATEGAARFTCARVAERAGVSVGSLYQYFPNKAAILFRLQTDEWRQTTEMLRSILADRSKPPAHRLRALVHAFVASECEEAQVRVALGDAAPLYRHAPEAREARAAGSSKMAAFVAEALPGASGSALETATELIEMTLNQVAKRFSGQPRTTEAIAVFSDALADMLVAYLDAVARGSRPRPEDPLAEEGEHLTIAPAPC